MTETTSLFIDRWRFQGSWKASSFGVRLHHPAERDGGRRRHERDEQPLVWFLQHVAHRLAGVAGAVLVHVPRASGTESSAQPARVQHNVMKHQIGGREQRLIICVPLNALTRSNDAPIHSGPDCASFIEIHEGASDVRWSSSTPRQRICSPAVKKARNSLAR